MIPSEFKQYIDEFTYKDTCIALDILRKNKCPLYLQAEYVRRHPSVLKSGNKTTLRQLSKEIDVLNEKICEANEIVERYNTHIAKVHHLQVVEINK